MEPNIICKLGTYPFKKLRRMLDTISLWCHCLSLWNQCTISLCIKCNQCDHIIVRVTTLKKHEKRRWKVRGGDGSWIMHWYNLPLPCARSSCCSALQTSNHFLSPKKSTTTKHIPDEEILANLGRIVILSWVRGGLGALTLQVFTGNFSDNLRGLHHALVNHVDICLPKG